MKQSELKKMIKGAVKEAIQEELKDILLEAVRAPKQQVVESIQPQVQRPVEGPSMSSAERRNAYQNILGDMQASFGTQHVEQPLQLTGNIDTSSPQGKLPEGNVSMDQIMNLMNK
jgi:hypothetical protein